MSFANSSKTEYKKLVTRLKHLLLMEPRAELWSIPKSWPRWIADFSNWGCRYWTYPQSKPDTSFLPSLEKLAGFQAITEELDVYHNKRMTVSLKQKINQLGQQGITQVNPEFHISSYPKDLSSLLLHCSYQSVSGRQFKQVIRIQKQLQQEQLVPENGSCNSCPLLPAEIQKLLTLLTRELRIIQRKGVSKDWVQDVLKKQRRDAQNVNQYISRKDKTLPVWEG